MTLTYFIAKVLGRRQESMAGRLAPVVIECDRAGISITTTHAGVRDLVVSFGGPMVFSVAAPSPGRALIPWSFVRRDARGEAAFRAEYLLNDERVRFRGAVRAATTACMSVSEQYADA